MNHPGYLNSPQTNYVDYAPKLGGQSVAGHSMTTREIAEYELKERETHRRMMIGNLTDTARSLEYVRQALMDLDMQTEAWAIDGVINAMINKWNEERAKR